MTRTRMVTAVVAVVIVATVGAACGSDSEPSSRAAEADGTSVAGGEGGTAQVTDESTRCPTSGADFESGRLYIEHNATDGDTGVHGLFGAEGWTRLCITDPTGRRILQVRPEADLGVLGLADLFFESREPENVDYPIAELMADFPEGDYLVGAVDFEGGDLVGSARFTHDIPAEPEIVSPALAEDAETASEATLPAEGLVVEWEPVTTTLTGDPLSLVGYELIVTDEEFEDPDSLAKPIYDVHVGPDVTSLAIADGFLVPGRIYEVEVLALEESGNQTITIGFFTAS